jgi:hypothetical protein
MQDLAISLTRFWRLTHADKVHATRGERDLGARLVRNLWGHGCLSSFINHVET